MTDPKGEFPTIIGPDAKFKGELTFETAARIDGGFEGKIYSKGSLVVGEGAKIQADIEAANVRLEGECKGNVVVTEKLQLMATAKLEGDLKTTRLEIADGAIFVGNVTVGQTVGDSKSRRSPASGIEVPQSGSMSRDQGRSDGSSAGGSRARPQEVSTTG